jgi:hypothetical protein
MTTLIDTLYKIGSFLLKTIVNPANPYRYGINEKISEFFS